MSDSRQNVDPALSGPARSDPALSDLAPLRRDYAAGGLAESDLTPDPLAMVRRWLADAAAGGIREPNAMVVSTADADGAPSSRVVLLKGLDEHGFVFFTNYGSDKGVELEANPRCALLFPWHDLERQVRVQGRVTRLAREDSEAYFHARPRGSQLGAWASPQSQVVGSRAALDTRYAEAAERFGDGEVPLPDFWGGFCVAPESVELWQGRTSRMHDRLRYRTTSQGGWKVERLAP